VEVVTVVGEGLVLSEGGVMMSVGFLKMRRYVQTR
jgi:hypothetical protein